MDLDTRELERALAAEPTDVGLKQKLRNAYVRAGTPERALPLQKGDRIKVTEAENGWVKGEWEGEVAEILQDGDLNVKPLNPDKLDYRVRPSPEYLASGLYITSTDAKNAVITVPVMI